MALDLAGQLPEFEAAALEPATGIPHVLDLWEMTPEMYEMMRAYKLAATKNGIKIFNVILAKVGIVVAADGTISGAIGGTIHHLNANETDVGSNVKEEVQNAGWILKYDPARWTKFQKALYILHWQKQLDETSPKPLMKERSQSTPHSAPVPSTRRFSVIGVFPDDDEALSYVIQVHTGSKEKRDPSAVAQRDEYALKSVKAMSNLLQLYGLGEETNGKIRKRQDGSQVRSLDGQPGLYEVEAVSLNYR
ncbi:hypothetical protein EJ08DRAFT_477040 [Tothia fuscella]|uniref:Uncharacterized protein n=1 Tax=Tothia fuscella TaxID=1048955 RepID=A0A9P4NI66_9PEZI|nr:hypothetical protein EJ08DRAFT_477040 [Tothia fuscella]